MDKKEFLISVIMPCYNAQEYLVESINSVANSTYADKCELIVVNDGSTDKTEEIVLNIQEKQCQLKIVYTKMENCGVSSARNIGLKMAKGQYIAFLDADDVLSATMLESLYTGLTKFNADFNCCFWSSDINNLSSQPEETINVYKNEILDFFLYRSKPIGLWSCIYKREIIDSNAVRFDECTKYGEDIEFFWNYILSCNSFSYIPKPMYFYRDCSSSAMHKTTWDKTKLIDVTQNIGTKIEDIYPEYSDKYNNYSIARCVISLQKDFALYGSKELFQKMRNKYKNVSLISVLKVGKLSIRISALLYMLSPSIFYYLFSKVIRKGKLI